MRYFLIAVIFSVVSPQAFSQNQEVLKILQDQVKAFNAKDVDKLVINVTEDFKWYYIGADTLLLEVEGQQQFKKNMVAYFEHIKTIKSEIVEYAVEGNRISFKEVVAYETTGGKRGKASAMAVYEIKDHLIYRVWYFY